MYQDYFGLREAAFSIAVNPRYFYMSVQHKEALAHVLYGIQGGGFVLLSGEVGTGKTTVIRCLLQQLPPNTEVAFVLNPMANVEDMLGTICEELRIDISDNQLSIKAMMDLIQKKLLRNHAAGKRTVLLIDEAQLLSVDVLEQIRLLTNLETDTEKLLQIVLVGQPELDDLLAQPRLRQLSQRITARFKLTPLDLIATNHYIKHRLRVAGKQDERSIFSPALVKKIHNFSGGIPRLINILCERLLIGAYGHNKIEVDNEVFELALKEVANAKADQRAATANNKKISNAILYAATAFVVVLCIAAVFIFVQKTGSVAEPQPTREMASQQTQAPQPNSTVQTSLANNVSFSNRNEAYGKLFEFYGYNGDNLKHPCWQTDRHQLSCALKKLETWDQLKKLNRPAILSLVTPDRRRSYAIITSLNETEAQLLDHEGNKHSQLLSELGPQWDGSAYYLWRKPEGYEKPLAIGSRSPVVSWVAEQFALLDGQARAITDAVFNQRLETRIKIFQSSENLKADGIIGEQTLMKLNERLGLISTLDQDDQ
ncbi:AAA family ATPase [Agaribacterium sp. ZY112]|uniref:ExeA family protein n=1 Tax=Agaribacterium sp. ZY112 TaxID=3233574 RepID=UPI0035260646